MTTTGVEQYPEEALRQLYINLVRKEDWDNECELCTMPTLLHSDVNGTRIHGACTRRTELTEDEITKEWRLFSKKMKAVKNWYIDDMEKKQTKNKVDEIEKLVIEVAKGRTNKLIKPAKVPSWSKGMQLRAYKKSIEVWMENNKDMPEAAKYQDIIETLKMNKEIEGLSKYIGEHVVGKLDTINKQTVKT